MQIPFRSPPWGFAQRDACLPQAGSKRQPLTSFVGCFWRVQARTFRYFNKHCEKASIAARVPFAWRPLYENFHDFQNCRHQPTQLCASAHLLNYWMLRRIASFFQPHNRSSSFIGNHCGTTGDVVKRILHRSKGVENDIG